ncbi:MAG: 4-hydroxy-tetrahydrodipicolinate reductase [Acidimicrobiales bacterium]
MSDSIRVGVLGAGGRMGREICRSVTLDSDLELVVAVDPRFAGIDIGQVAGPDVTGLDIAGDIEALARGNVDVAVDFTIADATLRAMDWCAAHGVHMVVGTTGFGDDDISRARTLFEDSDVNCLVASNFAVGAVLMNRFVEIAARYMNGAEVIEIHHDQKVDAPSGTALRLADSIAHGASLGSHNGHRFGVDNTERHVVEGVRGGAADGGIRIHSLRIPGMVAHHEVVFGSVGQALTIRHDAFDRTSFMPGVLMATKAVRERRGLTIGLDSLLGI